jgi:hypothetical protein
MSIKLLEPPPAYNNNNNNKPLPTDYVDEQSRARNDQEALMHFT